MATIEELQLKVESLQRQLDERELFVEHLKNKVTTLEEKQKMSEANHLIAVESLRKQLTQSQEFNEHLKEKVTIKEEEILVLTKQINEYDILEGASEVLSDVENLVSDVSELENTLAILQYDLKVMKDNY